MSIPSPQRARPSSPPLRIQTSSPNPSRRSSLRRRIADNGVDSPSDLHPLSALSSHEDGFNDDESDVSRPTLRRLTSDIEKQVAESSKSGGGVSSEASGSVRGSFDLLRMSRPDEQSTEVEVLVHHVKPTESLAGIALLYGIDLPTLRKINKLWASDPVHLRTHLYVPIEACRWNKASETFIRGPGPGQITLVPKTSSSRKGKTPMRSRQASTSATKIHDLASSGISGLEGLEIEEDGWGDLSPFSPAKQFLNGTNESYERSSLDSIRPTSFALEEEEQEPEQRILDVVRIPNSQLRFFPRPQKPPDTKERRSMEQDMRRMSIEENARRSSNVNGDTGRASGPSIKNDLSTLPLPLQPAVSKLPLQKGMVKIRPSESIGNLSSLVPTLTSSTSSIADKFTSFFNIPPPPDDLTTYSTMPSRGIQRNRPKLPFESTSTNGSRKSSAAEIRGDPDIPLEMRKNQGSRREGKARVTNKKLD